MTSVVEPARIEGRVLSVHEGSTGVDQGPTAPGGQARHTNEASSSTRQRLNTIGWGLVFLLIGSLALPRGQIEYAAVTTVGALMLALNAVLVAVWHKGDLFTSVLGATALIAGLGAMAGVTIDAFALFFLLLGSFFVVVPLVRLADRRR